MALKDSLCGLPGVDRLFKCTVIKNGPTVLPNFEYQGRKYTVDERLAEVRSIEMDKEPIWLRGEDAVLLLYNYLMDEQKRKKHCSKGSCEVEKK